jgi:hypothetical protein
MIPRRPHGLEGLQPSEKFRAENFKYAVDLSRL